MRRETIIDYLFVMAVVAAVAVSIWLIADVMTGFYLTKWFSG